MYAFRFTLSHRCCLFLGGNYPILCAGNPMFHKPFAVFWCSVDVFPVDPSIPFFECNIYTNEPPKVASANMRFPLVNPLIYHIVLEHYGFILLWCGPSSIHCAYVYIYISIYLYSYLCVWHGPDMMHFLIKLGWSSLIPARRGLSTPIIRNPKTMVGWPYPIFHVLTLGQMYLMSKFSNHIPLEFHPWWLNPFSPRLE